MRETSLRQASVPQRLNLTSSNQTDGPHFLDDLAQAFARRRKAIRHHSGELTVESLGDDADPCLEFVCYSRCKPSVILRAYDDRALYLWIRSQRAQNRGRILVCIDNLHVTADTKSIVELFEWTIHEAFWFPDSNPDGARDQMIQQAWRRLSDDPPP